MKTNVTCYAGEIGIYPPKWPKTVTVGGVKFTRHGWFKGGKVYGSKLLGINLFVKG